jgi:hypothetical protein
LFVIQRPQQRAASALPHRFCFAEKLPILAIFGDFWQYLEQKMDCLVLASWVASSPKNKETST